LEAVASALVGHRRIALDTSIWIYHFEGSAAYGRAADSVLEAVNGGQVAGVASELVLLELLVAPLKKGAQDTADEIELILLHFPHLQLAPVTRSVLLRAAEIRARHGLRTPDAIMIATAIESDATLAVTNDRDWQKVDEIEILLLQDPEETIVTAGRAARQSTSAHSQRKSQSGVDLFEYPRVSACRTRPGIRRALV